jgi:hypothetical protein
MGIVTGIMSITKNEGTHRWLIILLLFTFIYQIPWRKWKYLFIALPLWISLKYFHWINMPDTSSYNEYLDHIVLNWDHFRFQAPIIAQALLHSFKYEGLFKSHWLVMLFFALFSLRDVQQNQNKNLRQAFSFCLILFFVNCLYNSLPMLITKPPGTYSIEIISIADNLISRLNCQSASFLALACLIAIITFYRKIGVKPLPSGMGI